MKFEKLNENKIKITLSMRDLEEKDINFHDFMANSLESQEIFMDMLEEAEEKIGFKTNNCKVKIEALAMSEDDFVLTITKFPSESIRKRLYVSTRKAPIVKRKSNNVRYSHIVYRFTSFDDYCNYIEFLFTSNFFDCYKIAKEICLYSYNNSYYLVLGNLNSKYTKFSTFFNIISEFGSYIINPDLFASKLKESGTIFIKNNAFKNSFIHFSKK